MPILIDVENDGWRGIRDLDALAGRAVRASLLHGGLPERVEVSLLFTGDDEAARINGEWRNKTYAPNVLSFPASPEGRVPQGEAKPLGDIVLAAGVVAREALEQSKSFEAHTVHLIVHGTLHLLGFDHMNATDAARMEAAEIAILGSLGYLDPYEQ